MNQYNKLLVSGVESLMCTTRAMTKMDELMAALLHGDDGREQ